MYSKASASNKGAAKMEENMTSDEPICREIERQIKSMLFVNRSNEAVRYEADLHLSPFKQTDFSHQNNVHYPNHSESNATNSLIDNNALLRFASENIKKADPLPFGFKNFDNPVNQNEFSIFKHLSTPHHNIENDCLLNPVAQPLNRVVSSPDSSFDVDLQGKANRPQRNKKWKKRGKKKPFEKFVKDNSAESGSVNIDSPNTNLDGIHQDDHTYTEEKDTQDLSNVTKTDQPVEIIGYLSESFSNVKREYFVYKKSQNCWSLCCEICDYTIQNDQLEFKHLRTDNHDKQLRKEKADAILYHLPDPLPIQVEAVTDCLFKLHNTHGFSDKHLEQRRDLVTAINNLISKKLPNCSIQLIGSSASGCGLRSSELDMILIVPPEDNAAHYLASTFDLLAISSEVKNVQSEFQEKIPKMTFKDAKLNLPCNIILDTANSQRITMLLSLYYRLDSRVPPLMTAFKHFAKICDIDQPNLGTLPGFSFPILLIYFLQQQSPPVLPVIQEDPIYQTCNEEDYVSKCDWKSKNLDSVGSLWIKLLRYYACEYKPGFDVVCITSSKKVTCSDKLWSTQLLAIEDPVQHRNLAHVIPNKTLYRYIMRCFLNAYRHFGYPRSSAGAIQLKSKLVKVEDVNDTDASMEAQIAKESPETIQMDNSKPTLNCDDDGVTDLLEDHDPDLPIDDVVSTICNMTIDDVPVKEEDATPTQTNLMSDLASSANKDFTLFKKYRHSFNANDKRTSLDSDKECFQDFILETESSLDDLFNPENIMIENFIDEEKYAREFDIDELAENFIDEEKYAREFDIDELAENSIDEETYAREFDEIVKNLKVEKGLVRICRRMYDPWEEIAENLIAEAKQSELYDIDSSELADNLIEESRTSEMFDFDPLEDNEPEIFDVDLADNLSVRDKQSKVAVKNLIGHVGKPKTDKRISNKREVDSLSERAKNLKWKQANLKKSEMTEKSAPKTRALVRKDMPLHNNKVYESNDSGGKPDAPLLQNTGSKTQIAYTWDFDAASIGKEELLYTFQKKYFKPSETMPVVCRLCSKSGHLKSKCPDEILPPLIGLPLMTQQFLEIINKACLDVMNQNQPSGDEMTDHHHDREELQSYIREIFPDAELELFGSYCNGFGFTNSDLDFCLTFKDNKDGKGLDTAAVIEALAKKIKEILTYSNVIPIISAKVPIVKFMNTKSGLECDISLYNTLAKHNTRMLQAYCRIDPRVKIIGYMLKYFAKVLDICDASRGSLSSYAYILMALFFLQQREHPVIPVLQELYTDEKPVVMVNDRNVWFFSEIEKLKEVWPEYGKNNESVGSLWLGLLNFYASEFNMAEYVISIRQKSPLKRFTKLWNSKKIAIEDPFDLSHNLGAGLSRKMNNYIRKSFIYGREHFGTPVPVEHIQRYFGSDILGYFFDRKALNRGLEPPNDRGCRRCGKIGHTWKNCPAKSAKVYPARKKDVRKKIRSDAKGKYLEKGQPQSTNPNRNYRTSPMKTPPKRKDRQQLEINQPIYNLRPQEPLRQQPPLSLQSHAYPEIPGFRLNMAHKGQVIPNPGPGPVPTRPSMISPFLTTSVNSNISYSLPNVSIPPPPISNGPKPWSHDRMADTYVRPTNPNVGWHQPLQQHNNHGFDHRAQIRNRVSSGRQYSPAVAVPLNHVRSRTCSESSKQKPNW